jgi:DnaJ family protein B protein 12
LLPIIILFVFALISLLPSILSGSLETDPGYTFEPLGKYSMDRSTWQRGVNYYVDKTEWEESALWKSVPEEKKGQKDMAMYSHKYRVFETGIENDYINRLRHEVSPLYIGGEQGADFSVQFFRDEKEAADLG